MTRTQRRALGGVAAVVGIVLVVASAYLGLEKADKLASIISAITGAGSLILAFLQFNGREQVSSQQRPSQVQRSGNNSANIQSGGDLTIGDNNRFGDNS